MEGSDVAVFFGAGASNHKGSLLQIIDLLSQLFIEYPFIWLND
jgi:hypothetical protein